MKAKYLALFGTTLTLALASSAAVAQETTTKPAPEIKLSPGAMEILCKRFPLNSRCPGGKNPTGSTTTPSSTTTPDSSGSMSKPDSPTSPETTAPGSPSNSMPGSPTKPDNTQAPEPSSPSK